MPVRKLVTAFTLKRFERDRQVRRLEIRLAASPTLNVFTLLENFNRLSRTDEHLHSKMIEFLLNPRSTQPLGDSFLRELLARGRFYRGGTRIPGPRREANLAATESRREAPAGDGRVDIRLRSDRHNFIVLIENKTLSSERKHQLSRYWNGMETEYPGARIAGFFLTPDRKPPRTSGSFDFVSLSYEDIATLLDKAIAQSKPNSSLHAIAQYAGAIRRWFVTEPAMKELAWSIGQKSLGTIDFLTANTPHRQIEAKLEELINRSPLKCFKRWGDGRRFELVIEEWETLPKLRRGGLHKPADSRLLYIAINNPRFDGNDPDWLGDELAIHLTMPPGKNGKVRKMLHKAISEKHLAPAPKPFDDDWLTLWSDTLASREQLKTKPRDKLLQVIETRYERFSKLLPRIQAAVTSIR